MISALVETVSVFAGGLPRYRVTWLRKIELKEEDIRSMMHTTNTVFILKTLI
jgi:hypothetical protein